MIQIAKNKLFGHFLEIGRSDGLEIVYYHRTKQCAGLANPWMTDLEKILMQNLRKDFFHKCPNVSICKVE